jgi:transcriptional regulator with XRE-family HTH domain
MSQLELDQKAQLDLTTINEIKNGNREPMLRIIWRISNNLDIPLNKLFEL